MVLIPRKYVVAVENGVKWLDLTLGRKRWLRRMNLKGFDINSGKACVAGTVFQDAFFKDDNEEYGSDGYDRFISFMRLLGAEGAIKDGMHLGFYTDSDQGMQYLQDLWVAKIKKLKRAAHSK